MVTHPSVRIEGPFDGHEGPLSVVGGVRILPGERFRSVGIVLTHSEI